MKEARIRFLSRGILLLVIAILLVLSGILGLENAAAMRKDYSFPKRTRIAVSPIAPSHTLSPVPSGSPENMPLALESKILDAPYIDQRGNFPTGCEPVTAVMALQAAGVDITVDNFVDLYLETGAAPHFVGDTYYGANPWETFIGDPRSEEGWGCYAPVIVNAIKKLIDRDVYTAEILRGTPIDELCSTYINRDVPVIFWATMGMTEPRESTTWLCEKTGEETTWITPEHCLLLVGYDSDYYYFNDPLADEKTAYPKEQCEAAYEGMFSQAVVVYKDE